jgi:hypothetical protein
MNTPFDHIRPGRLRRVAGPILALYLLAWVPFILVGEGGEMVRLQMAGSETKARRILDGWSHAQNVDVAYLVGVDHVHLVAYSVLLALATVWASRHLRGRAARWARLVAWSALAAAVFDVLENVGMIVMIRGRVEAPVPAMTMSMSLMKFSLAAVTVPFVLAGSFRRLRGRRSG